jgi:hypothetical protein
MHDHQDDHAGPGHNRPGASPAQWQTPHLPSGTKVQVDERAEPDVDLVEESFIEGFGAASDPTSFLRLAGIPFSFTDANGKTFSLLRVQMDQTTDVGSVTPHLGGQSYRYDPLPAKLVSKRQQLRFVYHDGETLRHLSFSEARSRKDHSDLPRQQA